MVWVQSFLCMYDPYTDLKSDAEKTFLFKVRSMLQHLQRNFELYWDPAWYLIIYEKTILFQVRHKDNIRIMFKGAGDCFQADTVCDCGRTYFFIYCNDDITDSKYYLFVSRERVIWRLKRPKKY